MVCWGIKFNVNSSVPNTSGTVIFTTLDNPVSPNQTWTSGAMDGAEVETHVLQTGAEFTWLSRPTGSGATLFVAQNNTTAPNAYWTSLLCDFYGGAVSPAGPTYVEYEVCMNVEMQINTSGALQGINNLVGRDPPANPTLLAKVSAARDAVPTIVVGPSDVVKEKLSRVARGAATYAMDSALEGAMGFLGFV